jgi:hypothetical protein
VTGGAPIVAVLAALVGASVAAAAGGPTRPWLVAAVAAISTLAALAVRLTDAAVGDRGAHRRWRRFEPLGGVIGIRLLQASTGGAVGAVADRETLVAGAVFLVVRASARATFDDLDAIETGVGRADGGDPIARLRQRIVGFGLVATVAGGYAVLGVREVFDLGRPAASGMRVEPVIYLAVALPALAWAALRAQAARWRRERATVASSTGESWLRRGFAVSVAVVGVVLAVWLGSFGASSIAARGVIRAGPVGEWVAGRLAALGDLEATPGERRPAQQTEAPSEFDTAANRTPPWLGEAMFWAIAVGFIAWAGRKGRRVGKKDRVPGRTGRSAKAGDVIRAVLGMLAAMWRALVGLVRGARRMLASGQAPAAESRRPPQPWNPVDPVRARIARAYRRSAAHVATRVGGRRRGETMREFARRSGASVPDWAEDFDTVTGAYELARFSDHELTAGQASVAEQAAFRVERRPGSDPG